MNSIKQIAIDECLIDTGNSTWVEMGESKRLPFRYMPSSLTKQPTEAN